MKHILLAYALLHVFSAAAALDSSNSCFMSEQQQRRTILTEGPKAIHDQVTSDCFQRLVKDEIQLLKQGSSPLASDKDGVIENMLLAALRQESVKTESAE